MAYADRVSHGATRIAVRVRVSARGTLRAAGRRYRVGAKTQTLRMPLPTRPVMGLLTLPFSVTSDRSRTSGTIATVRP